VAMNAVLRNGFGTSGGSVTSLNFQPDLFWEKARNNAYNHQLVDSVRGVANVLNPNLTNAENSQPTYMLSFNSNGYTLGANDYGTGVTLVDWCWKAGGTAVSNTAGTITSTVSANTTAGFSVVTYTGTGANATVGHGLGVAPSMIIVKKRSAVSAWIIGFTFSGFNWGTDYFQFDATAKRTDGAGTIFTTTPSSTVFSIGVDASMNTSSGTYVAYCWAPVAGYSAFGSYTGNGLADGTFIYTGFRPRYVLIKSSSASGSWFINDTSREPYNLMNVSLRAETADPEATGGALAMDALSNGFKMRDAGSGSNGSGVTYIYAAYAENPLKYANAR